VEANYRRALALCEQGKQTPYVFSAQLGLWAHYQLSAQYETALPLGERLLALALETQKPKQLAEAHRVLAATTFRLGRLDMARNHAEQVLALQCQEPTNYDFLQGYGRDPAVHATSTLGWILWYLGFPDQARARSQEALVMARARPDAYNLALCLVFAAEVHRCRREAHLTREYAEAAIEVSREQGFPIYLAWGTALQGWVLAGQGHYDEGITRIQQGMAAYAATGSALGRPDFLGLLADAYAMAGQVHAGLESLTEALALAQASGEQLDSAALYRLKGELILRQSGEARRPRAGHEEAEACFREAIAIARHQGARSLELKAALSLAGLWRQQGRLAQARDALAGIHGTFTEGTDTADWQEAKALLDDLARQDGTAAARTPE
jgi:tetratricopeptide (TPR) repeat protein